MASSWVAKPPTPRLSTSTGGSPARRAAESRSASRAGQASCTSTPYPKVNESPSATMRVRGAPSGSGSGPRNPRLLSCTGAPMPAGAAWLAPGTSS